MASDDNNFKQSKKPKTGFFEGLKLLISKPYIMGIFIVSSLYEVIGTVLEYQMTSLAEVIYTSKEALSSFQGWYGVGINALAMVFALLGSGYIIRNFGFRFCLVAFPSVIAVVVTCIFGFNLFSVSNYSLMLAFCFGMIIIKGLSYALNNPAKEVMYIPTSKDVKFKAKGWIDSFGNRTTKAAGGSINTFFRYETMSTILFSYLFITMGIVAFWIVIAMFVGNKFNDLQKKNEIVS